jgi:hypothetical protein
MTHCVDRRMDASQTHPLVSPAHAHVPHVHLHAQSRPVAGPSHISSLLKVANATWLFLWCSSAEVSLPAFKGRYLSRASCLGVFVFHRVLVEWRSNQSRHSCARQQPYRIRRCGPVPCSAWVSYLPAMLASKPCRCSLTSCRTSMPV